MPLAAWVWLLAFHDNFVKRSMLKRSEKKSQIKAVVPMSKPDDDQDEFDGE